MIYDTHNFIHTFHITHIHYSHSYKKDELWHPEPPNFSIPAGLINKYGSLEAEGLKHQKRNSREQRNMSLYDDIPQAGEKVPIVVPSPSKSSPSKKRKRDEEDEKEIEAGPVKKAPLPTATEALHKIRVSGIYVCWIYCM